jgi:hypothetical protein
MRTFGLWSYKKQVMKFFQHLDSNLFSRLIRGESCQVANYIVGNQNQLLTFVTCAINRLLRSCGRFCCCCTPQWWAKKMQRLQKSLLPYSNLKHFLSVNQTYRLNEADNCRICIGLKVNRLIPHSRFFGAQVFFTIVYLCYAKCRPIISPRSDFKLFIHVRVFFRRSVPRCSSATSAASISSGWRVPVPPAE